MDPNAEVRHLHPLGLESNPTYLHRLLQLVLEQRILEVSLLHRLLDLRLPFLGNARSGVLSGSTVASFTTTSSCPSDTPRA
jgi:hypothetical protein